VLSPPVCVWQAGKEHTKSRRSAAPARTRRAAVASAQHHRRGAAPV